MKVSDYIANFDSASVMVRALGRSLEGKPVRPFGTVPRPLGRCLRSMLGAVNRLPRWVKEQLYSWSGWKEAIRPSRLGEVRSDDVARWVTDLFPDRSYPAVMVGSAGGAGVHLCAALGIPWLPQTFLIPVRRHNIHPDEPTQDMEWAREPARRLLEANPNWQLHHMNDANQDRLMIRHMTYFRVKQRRLGEVYEAFLNEVLEPGGTLIINECTLSWPTRRIGERHVFQHGALGGATAEEFRHGSPRVADYLKRYHSHRRAWPSPETDAQRPEAEWGFEPSLRDDVERFAREHGYDVERLVYPLPQTLSPLVADLHRWWYRNRGRPARRLVVGSFILMDPWAALRTGSVPYWMTFNKEPSADGLEQYLDGSDPFDEIFMTIFSHGVDSVGLVPIERWQTLLNRARRRGEFLGVDVQNYPRDFAVFARSAYEMLERISARYPVDRSLTLDELEAFLERHAGDYGVEWSDGRPDTGRERARRGMGTGE